MWTELQPGTVFGHDYRILRHMASGGMGSIYLVEQLSTGKPRALKVMHPQYARDERLRARFEKEARVASLIESDHVIEVLAAGVDKATGIPWLVMEYLRGETLDDVVAEKGPLSIPDMLEVSRQLLHGLECAHRQALVHRDLKPENIFIAQPRRTDIPFTVKILDFGIAKWAQDARQKSKNSEVLGSPFWMAPEQLQAGADISPATDVWALGLIVFWSLTGHYYWMTGNLDDATIDQVIREMTVEAMPPASSRLAELDPRQKLPRRFDAWFERTTQRRSDRRFQTGGEALSVLLPILSEHMTESSKPAFEARAESLKETPTPAPKVAEVAAKKTPTPSSPIAPAIITPAEPQPIENSDAGRISDAGRASDAGRISDVGRISDLPSVDDPIAALTESPHHINAWLGLFKRRLQERNLDGAWCVADAATAMLGDRTPEPMKQLRARHAAGASRKTLAPLTESQWRALCDPALLPATTEVLQGLVGVLQALKSASNSPRSAALHPGGGSGSKIAPPAGAAKLLYGALLEAAAALSISPLPLIEVRADKPFGLWFSGSVPPSSIVGAGGAQPKPWRTEAIAFAAGQHMAYYRPELSIRLVTSGEEEIQQALDAVRAITTGKGQSPLAAPLAQRLGSGDRMRLRRVVNEAVAEPFGMDAARWQRAADRTAARAGFLASRDYGAAREALKAIDPLPGAPGLDPQMHNLVLFGVSDPYLKLRRELEIALL